MQKLTEEQRDWLIDKIKTEAQQQPIDPFDNHGANVGNVGDK